MTRHLKLIALLIFTLPASYTSAQSLRRLPKHPCGIIESKWEKGAQGATEFNYYNKSYCDYYLYHASDRFYNLSNGKNTIFKIEKNTRVDNPLKGAFSYAFCRDKFPKDFNIQTSYALPVKNNQKTAQEAGPREPFEALNFRIKRSDAIYTTHNGIAYKTISPQQLLIYHPDRTFVTYLAMNENFIESDEEMQVGQAIGKAGLASTAISFFFPDEDRFKGGLSPGYPYSYLTPIFRTTEGGVKPKEKTIYQAVTDRDLIMQDMSRRSKKKYTKLHNLK